MKKVSDEKILEFIANYIQKHGYAPSLGEIGEAVGLKSKNSIWNRIQGLLRKGLLETDHDGSPRTIRIPGYKFVKEEQV